MTKLIHVAVGVIVGIDGKILIAKRPHTAHQGGLWEFPGGKVDAGESVHQALVRELQEELAIAVTASEPLIQIRHHYPDKSVLLDVYKVTGFDGEPSGAEGQPICWVAPTALDDFEFPAANRPIISAITFPDRYLVTGNFSDVDDFCYRLSAALEQGIRLIQLRLPDLNFIDHRLLLDRVIALSEQFSATLLLNSNADRFLQIIANYPAAKLGLHLNGRQASLLNARPIPSIYLLGVSCHNEKEIIQAQQLGADYLLLSPVNKTQSHPDVKPMGWEVFASFVAQANVPVYALGGVGEGDLLEAKLAGAQGVAGISAWW